MGQADMMSPAAAKSWTGPERTVRRHGRHVVQVQCHAGKASRAYDKIATACDLRRVGGILVLEELEHARARGAKIYAELVGYGATADGADMVAPSGEGAVRCMQMALQNVKAPVDYIIPTPPRRQWAIIHRDQRHQDRVRGQHAADQRHKSPHRPQPGGGGRSRSDLLPFDDAGGFYLRKRQYRGTRSRGRRRQHRAQAHRQRQG